MNPLVGIAAFTITCALVFYTLGVFGERKNHLLQKRHVVLFWIGFACDTTGTLIMSNVAQSSGGAGSAFHAITGMVAIALMLIHALWATLVVFKGKEKARRIFGKFSIMVWLAWLVPYVCGMLAGIPFISLGNTTTLIAALATTFTIACILHFQSRGSKDVSH